MINVLLADDHHLVRRGFCRMLEDDPEIRVVGEASTGDEAVRLAVETQPDVVVMDAAMPGIGGLVATRTLLERVPSAVVLMLSMHSEQTVVHLALAAGARGYVLKNAIDLDLADVVRCTVYLKDVSDFPTMDAVFREYFPTDPPVRATVGVVALARDYRIEVEATAAR